jgi:hypothetical protein
MNIDEVLNRMILGLPSDPNQLKHFYEDFQGFANVRSMIKRAGYELGLVDKRGMDQRRDQLLADGHDPELVDKIYKEVLDKHGIS